MRTKLDQLKEFAAQGDWQRAIAMAAKFPQLGPIREAVLDAHTAYVNPRFLAQLKGGRDLADIKQAGKEALIRHYRLP